MTLGNWLKQYREQQKMGQPELAQSIGIEQSYLSKLENDKSLPSAEILDNIINATQTTLDKLVAGLDSQYVYNQLSRLPQVKAFLANQKQQSVQQTNKKLFIFGLMLTLGCFIFYLGYGQVLSSNVRYQYYSPGILKPNESLKAYDKTLSSAGRMSEEDYGQRYNPKTIVMEDRQIRSFVSDKPGERRFFRYHDELHGESGFNKLLKAIGVLLFSGGFFGVVLLLINRKMLTK